LVVGFIGNKANKVITSSHKSTLIHVRDELKAQITFHCCYLGLNKLSRVGGWLAGESINEANLKPTELN